ncbi:hypothetical protein RB653_007353 [Dictyostelium firmibasis]|uniref:PD-(D/E)XK endonuclease-like domain-containing protein n=1 Tax=Dictyostelium firmibasis TaxID=79012 RepID=A0AAN7TLN1_9MYCE
MIIKIGEIAKQFTIKRVSRKGVRFYEISDSNKPNEEKLLYPSVSSVLSIIDQPSFKLLERDRLFKYFKKSFEESLKNGEPIKKSQEYLFKKQLFDGFQEESFNTIKYGAIIGTDSHNVIDDMVGNILEKGKSDSKPLKSLVDSKDIIHLDDNDKVIEKPIKTKTESQEAQETSTIPKELLENVPQKVENVKSSFELWDKLSGLKFEHRDTLVYSNKYGFAGACDAVARKPNGELVLLDWKTSSSLSLNHALQVSAYSKAVEEMTGEKISEAWIVKFQKSSPIFDSYSVKDIDGCFDSFLAALKLWNIYNIDKINDEKSLSAEKHFFTHLPSASSIKPLSSFKYIKKSFKSQSVNSLVDINNGISNDSGVDIGFDNDIIENSLNYNYSNIEINGDGFNNDNSNSSYNGFNDDNNSKLVFSQNGGIIIPNTIRKIKKNK